MAEKIRVLYVDDESALLDIGKLYLERSGEFTVTIATSAPEAIRILGQETFDTIVSDYQMPDMDGIEFLKHLKSEGNTTPFIIFTGKGREEVVIEALNAGADGYLQKGGESKSQFAELSHKIKKAVEGRQAEEAFKDSEERFRSLFDSALDIIQIIRPDGSFLHVNPAWKKTLGYSDDDVRTLSVFDIFHPDSLAHCSLKFRELLSGTKAVNIEAQFLTKDKKTISVEGNCTPEQKDGTVVSIRGIFHDITERKQAEDALRESEARYREFFSISRDSVFITSPEGRWIDFNDATLEIFGYESRKVLFEVPISSIYAHPEERAEFIRLIEQNGYVKEYPVQLKQKDGTVIETLITAAPVRNPDGPVKAFIGTIRDVTGRKRAEEEITRLASFPQLNPAMIFEIDPAEQVLFVNPAMQSTMNRLGLSSPLMFIPEDVHQLIREWDTRTRANYDRECSVADRQFLVSIYLSPEYRSIRFYLFDITGRKRAEEALRESEKRFRTIIHSVQFGIVIIDAQTHTILDANKKALEIIGGSSDIVIGSGCHRFICPAECGKCPVTDLKQTVDSSERVLLTLQGKKIPIIKTVISTTLEGKEVLIESFVDITEHKRAEEQLKESEEHLKGAQRVGHLGSWNLNVVTGNLQWSDECYRIYGFMPQEFVPTYEKFRSIVHPEDLGFVQEQVDAALNNDKHYDVDFRFVRPNGEIGWIQCEGEVTRDAEGKPLRFFGTQIDITGRKALEESLRQSEARFRALAENSSDIIRILDHDGRIVFDTAASEHLLGYPPGFTIGRDPDEFIHPDDLAMVKKKLSDLYARTNPGVPTEFRIRRADGSYTWVESLGKNLIGVLGVDGVVITTRFIDDRKKAEVALVESEMRYRALVDHALEAILIFDFSGTVLFANHATATLVEVDDPRTLTGRNALEFIAPESRDTVLADFASVMEGRDAYLAQYKVVTATGREKWVESIGKKIQFGGVPADIVMLRDITERKQAEESFAESESFNRGLVENLPDYIAIYGVDGNLLYVNPASATLLGYSAEKLVGTPVLSYVAEEYRNEVVSRLTDRREGSEIQPYEIDLLTHGGLRRSVIVKGTRIQYRDTPATLLVLTDITDRKLVEEALRQVNKQLNLLSSITRHDILNQLMALKGYIELSRDYLDDKKTLGDFLEKEEKAARTIEDQITFTKNYQELGIAAPEWQNVNASIEKAIAGLPTRDIHVDVDPKAPEIFADPLFEKVFYNLIDNALSYGGDQMKTIRVSSQESDASLTIICEDDGVGITAEDKKRLFTRGFGKNTGLGLFLSREILSITGITITENGTPGKGARFEIMVPKGMFRFMGTGGK